MRSFNPGLGIHYHANPTVLIVDLFPFINLAAVAQLKAAIFESRRGRDHPSGLQFDLHIEKIEMAKVLVRALVILISVWSLLSGCADTKQTEANSNSILQKPETDHEVHGEVGVMYGHSAR